jgi:hypothetical protein
MGRHLFTEDLQDEFALQASHLSIHSNKKTID